MRKHLQKHKLLHVHNGYGEMILQNGMKMWSYGHLPESVTENVVFAQDGHNL